MSSEVITRNDLKNIINSLLPIFYPVGSYYETSDTTFNPNTEWGGTWELETAGQVHVSSGSGYAVSGAETNTSDGGEATHRLADVEMAHGHGFTQPKTPNHTHTLTYAGDASSAMSGSNPSTLGSVVRRTTSSSTTGSWSTNSTGGGVACTGGAVSNLSGADSTRTAHNNMQPYIVVNRWHRVA